MKLRYAKFKNFKSYPDQETTVDLGFDGIKLLVAENGDGKSTIFDAIIWGLYGKNKDGVDGVVNRKTKKNCKAEIGFRVGNKDYSVIRYRKHETHGNKLMFFKGTKNISQRTTGATQEAIDNVIEIQYNTMISSVVLSSESYTSFLRSSRSDRLKTFESLLSLKEITLFYNKLKKLKEPVDEKVLTTDRDKEKIEVSISSLSENIDEYKEGVKKTLLQFKADKERLQDEVFKLTGKIAEYDTINVESELEGNVSFDAITERNTELVKLISEERKKLTDINELIGFHEKNVTTIEDSKNVDIQKELALIKDREDIVAKNLKIDQGIDKLSVGIVETKSMDNAVKRYEKEINSLEEDITKMEEHLDKCPTCGQDVEKELTEKLVAEKVERKEIITDKLEEENKKLFKSIEKNEEIGSAIIKLKNMVQEAGDESEYDRDYLLKLNDRIKALETDNLLIYKDIENGEKNNKVIKENVLKLETELEKNKVGLKQPEYHTMFLNDLKDKIVLLKDEAEEKRLEIVEIDVKAKSSYDKGYIDKTVDTIDKLKKSLIKTKKKLQGAIDEKNHYEALLTVFSNKDAGFKKFFINKMVSIFNDRVNFYLPFFFDEAMEIKFDKDLNEVIQLNGEEVTFASFSSGQKTRFDIAVSFSLFMMVKMFFSSTINLLVFDEILDMNLDKKGFNSVHEIIENLGEFNTVFVVSHQEFYKEKFNHHIHIKRNKDGFSYIHQEV